ncbi:hypothetical protein EDEG_02108 [Edhazardia aedis USNM 41457]|uniref:Uncharacterized protein n=1 Tax=Edhazardia aedis (strain USNM 41457) TaxID=1003232 RepID=J9D724_EDHAE|nr:hypothetical protein EDEG_02108 [Edhazardia aedis USNM 41457]|eukprot:EJW03566.1 hypothetical protein EDEG_02108 [Edhazardia aedis USNM 41457]
MKNRENMNKEHPQSDLNTLKNDLSQTENLKVKDNISILSQKRLQNKHLYVDVSEKDKISTDLNPENYKPTQKFKTPQSYIFDATYITCTCFFILTVVTVGLKMLGTVTNKFIDNNDLDSSKQIVKWNIEIFSSMIDVFIWVLMVLKTAKKLVKNPYYMYYTTLLFIMLILKILTEFSIIYHYSKLKLT